MVDSPTMQRPPTHRRHLILCTCLALLLPLAACGPETVSSDQEAEIKATLLEYLPVMSQGYASGNLEPLRDYTVEKEMARMFKRISDLAVEGKSVEPELKSLTIENIYMWGSGANATVTTFEIWDLRVYASSSGRLLAEETDQRNRVQYTLKHKGDRWILYNRELIATIQP